MRMKEAEELRCEGVIGIVRESVKIVAKEAKLFGGLVAALIVPLCAVGLGHSLITEPIAAKIRWDEYVMRRQSMPDSQSAAQQRIDEDILHEIRKLFIAFALYLFFLLAFFLLSTSAVVYSVASSIISHKSTSFRQLLFTIVPRVWKRLFLTFLWAIFTTFAYSVVFFAAFFLLAFLLFFLFSSSSSSSNDIAIAAFITIAIVSFVIGLIYVDCVWHLGLVVAVLEEEAHGLQAMVRSVRLIRGRLAMAYVFYFAYFMASFAVGVAFSVGVAAQAALVALQLLRFVVLTVFYFACKAYHNESIDKVQMSGHLEAYLGVHSIRTHISLIPP